MLFSRRWIFICFCIGGLSGIPASYADLVTIKECLIQVGNKLKVFHDEEDGAIKIPGTPLESTPERLHNDGKTVEVYRIPADGKFPEVMRTKTSDDKIPLGPDNMVLDPTKVYVGVGAKLGHVYTMFMDSEGKWQRFEAVAPGRPIIMKQSGSVPSKGVGEPTVGVLIEVGATPQILEDLQARAVARVGPGQIRMTGGCANETCSGLAAAGIRVEGMDLSKVLTRSAAIEGLLARQVTDKNGNPLPVEVYILNPKDTDLGKFRQSMAKSDRNLALMYSALAAEFALAGAAVGVFVVYKVGETLYFLATGNELFPEPTPSPSPSLSPSISRPSSGAR